jgi:hypothetical protein
MDSLPTLCVCIYFDIAVWALLFGCPPFFCCTILERYISHMALLKRKIYVALPLSPAKVLLIVHECMCGF